MNVAGHAIVSMSKVRDVVAALGFDDVRTVLQSGNVVFTGPARAGGDLEVLLEKALLARLEVGSDVFVRTAAEWAKIVAGNPFPDVAQRDPGRLVVVALKAAPDAAAVKALQAAVTGPEVIRAAGRELYITYPAGQGRSRLTGSVIERKLGTRATARNWNTVLKLHTLTS